MLSNADRGCWLTGRPTSFCSPNERPWAPARVTAGPHSLWMSRLECSHRSTGAVGAGESQEEGGFRLSCHGAEAGSPRAEVGLSSRIRGREGIPGAGSVTARRSPDSRLSGSLHGRPGQCVSKGLWGRVGIPARGSGCGESAPPLQNLRLHQDPRSFPGGEET